MMGTQIRDGHNGSASRDEAGCITKSDRSAIVRYYAEMKRSSRTTYVFGQEPGVGQLGRDELVRIGRLDGLLMPDGSEEPSLTLEEVAGRFVSLAEALVDGLKLLMVGRRSAERLFVQLDGPGYLTSGHLDLAPAEQRLHLAVPMGLRVAHP